MLVSKLHAVTSFPQSSSTGPFWKAPPSCNGMFLWCKEAQNCCTYTLLVGSQLVRVADCWYMLALSCHPQYLGFQAVQVATGHGKTVSAYQISFEGEVRGPLLHRVSSFIVFSDVPVSPSLHCCRVSRAGTLPASVIPVLYPSAPSWRSRRRSHDLSMCPPDSVIVWQFPFCRWGL